jgi:hypothetical protein
MHESSLIACDFSVSVDCAIFRFWARSGGLVVGAGALAGAPSSRVPEASRRHIVFHVAAPVALGVIGCAAGPGILVSAYALFPCGSLASCNTE